MLKACWREDEGMGELMSGPVVPTVGWRREGNFLDPYFPTEQVHASRLLALAKDPLLISGNHPSYSASACFSC